MRLGNGWLKTSGESVGTVRVGVCVGMCVWACMCVEGRAQVNVYSCSLDE